MALPATGVGFLLGETSGTVSIGVRADDEVLLDDLAMPDFSAWTGSGADKAARALLVGILYRRRTPAPPASPRHGNRPRGRGRNAVPWTAEDELWALIEPLLPPWPRKAPGPKPVDDRLCLQDPGLLRCLPHPCEKRGEATGPSPVDRGKTRSEHQLICDGKGTSFMSSQAAP